MGRARHVWTCPPSRDTEGTGKAGTVRATGLLRGWISGALHELCAWHRVWGLPTLGVRETEHPKELTGILAHQFGEGRTGGVGSAHSRLGGGTGAASAQGSCIFPHLHSTLAKLGLTSSQGSKGKEGGSILEMSPSQSSTVTEEGDPRQPRDAAEGPQGKMEVSAQATGISASRAVPIEPVMGGTPVLKL